MFQRDVQLIWPKTKKPVAVANMASNARRCVLRARRKHNKSVTQQTTDPGEGYIRTR